MVYNVRPGKEVSELMETCLAKIITPHKAESAGSPDALTKCPTLQLFKGADLPGLHIRSMPVHIARVLRADSS